MSVKVRALSDSEEAAVQASILQDRDNPEWTEAEMAAARPFAEVFPDLARSIARDGVSVQSPEQGVPVRLDPDVIEAFRATGPDWQSRINAVLRKAAGL